MYQSCLPQYMSCKGLTKDNRPCCGPPQKVTPRWWRHHVQQGILQPFSDRYVRPPTPLTKVEKKAILLHTRNIRQGRLQPFSNQYVHPQYH